MLPELDRCIQGDALETLRYLPDGFVDCCVTSPPYYGLRDYGVDGQIGLEDTPEKYVSKLVEVFREVRRVLTPEGTLWLNLGDSYSGSWGDYGARKGKQRELKEERFDRPKVYPKKPICSSLPGLKPKDLIGIPWMVAFALRADGWYLRSDIIWHKFNCMPESVTDRPTKSHEYVFLFAKSERYYYDSESIKEDAVSVVPSGNGFKGRQGGSARVGPQSGGEGSTDSWQPGGKRNKRSVWNVNVRPFHGAHFATFPEALVEPMMLAGVPVGGVCLDPFFGAGTVGVVAKKLGRRYLGIELNPDYVEMAGKRIDKCSVP